LLLVSIVVSMEINRRNYIRSDLGSGKISFVSINWTMQSDPPSQAHSSINSSVSWVGGFVPFCDTCFDFLPKFVIGMPIWPPLASQGLNTFLRSSQIQDSLFSFSRLSLLLR